MFGLNADPATDESFSSIDFAWYFRAIDGLVHIYEAGVDVATFDAYTTSTVLLMTYDGTSVRYYKDGVLKRTSVASGVKYFDSSFYEAGSNIGLLDVRFGPQGEKGATGSTGSTTWYSYNSNSSASQPATPTGDGTADGWSATLTALSVWVSTKQSSTRAGAEAWSPPVLLPGIAMTPVYRGRFNNGVGQTPADLKYRDFWLVYGTADTGAAPHTGVQRGVWFRNADGTNSRMTMGSDGSTYFLTAAMDDVLWAIMNGFGVASDYGYGTLFQYLAAAVIAAQQVNALDFVVGKCVRAGNAFDSDGNPLAGTRGFYLGADGTSKLFNAIISGYLDAADGTFKGLINRSSLFNMRPASSGGSAIAFPSKTRWLGSDLYSALSGIPTGGGWTAAVGTLGTKTVNYIARLASSSERTTIRSGGSSSSSGIWSGYTQGDTYTAAFAMASCILSASIDTGAFPSNNCGVRIKKNGTIIASSENNAGASCSVTTDIAVGDVLTVEYAHWQAWSWYYAYTLNKLNIVSKTVPSSGFWVLFSDGTINEYRSECFYADALSVTSPNSVSYSAYLNYATGADYVTAMSGYTLSIPLPVTSVNFYFNGSAKTISKVVKSNTGEAKLIFSDDTALVCVAPAGTAHDSYGYYNASGSYTVITATIACQTANLEPFTNEGSDIGTASLHYGVGYFKQLIGYSSVRIPTAQPGSGIIGDGDIWVV
jgi:hypothetical protein